MKRRGEGKGGKDEEGKGGKNVDEREMRRK